MTLKRFVPTADVGGSLWMCIEHTASGRVVKASVHLAAKADEAEETMPLDPRAAMRIIKDVAGFECEELRHLSLEETEGALSAKPAAASADPSAATAGDTLDVSDSAASREQRTPVRQVNDQFVLSRLEDFIESDAFNSVVRQFAAEHAHKFKPVTANEEHPLHYHELYRQYEALLETSLEAFLVEHGATVAQLVECVRGAQSRSEPLACVDLLLATSDYAAFLELMLDYKFDLIAEREETPDSITTAFNAPAPASSSSEDARGALRQ